MPLSQGDVLTVTKKILSKSTKRKKSRRRPFSMTKKRNDILKIVTNMTEDEIKSVHDSFAWAFFAK